jgi:hypothetical protein
MRRSGRTDDMSNAPSEHNTVFSDVSFMARDTVGFSLRLRPSSPSGIRPVGPSMMSTYLPDLVATPEDVVEETSEPPPRMTQAQLEKMMDAYDGCPEDHPDCNSREDRWEQIDEILRKDGAELAALEAVMFEAKVRDPSAVPPTHDAEISWCARSGV